MDEYLENTQKKKEEENSILPNSIQGEELLNYRLEEIIKMRPDVEYTETDKEALKILLKQMITEAHTLKVMEKMYKKSKTK